MDKIIFAPATGLFHAPPILEATGKKGFSVRLARGGVITPFFVTKPRKVSQLREKAPPKSASETSFVMKEVSIGTNGVSEIISETTLATNGVSFVASGVSFEIFGHWFVMESSTGSIWGVPVVSQEGTATAFGPISPATETPFATIETPAALNGVSETPPVTWKLQPKMIPPRRKLPPWLWSIRPGLLKLRNPLPQLRPR